MEERKKIIADSLPQTDSSTSVTLEDIMRKGNKVGHLLYNS